MVWACIGGTWQRYLHAVDEAVAKRNANKIGKRLKDCAERRKNDGEGETRNG
jgi:hypothetical protein